MVEVMLVEDLPNILFELGLIPTGVVVVFFDFGLRIVCFGCLSSVAVFLFDVE